MRKNLSYKKLPQWIVDILEIVKKLEKIKAEELMIMYHEMDPEIYKLIKDEISKFSEEEIKFYVKTIKEFNFRDKKYYKDVKIESKSDWYDYMDERCRFVNRLLTVINVTFNSNRKSSELERQVSPPSGVYEKKDIHNKTDIKPSVKAFGTLFE
ncbi:MAG: hypothetical protein NTW62_01805 [Candidatus Nomurabacteria bacterium]|nr:hypothetical protein [Candidatus Nomurabacteria bacterium]